MSSGFVAQQSRRPSTGSTRRGRSVPRPAPRIRALFDNYILFKHRHVIIHIDDLGDEGGASSPAGSNLSRRIGERRVVLPAIRASIAAVARSRNPNGVSIYRIASAKHLVFKRILHVIHSTLWLSLQRHIITCIIVPKHDWTLRIMLAVDQKHRIGNNADIGRSDSDKLRRFPTLALRRDYCRSLLMSNERSPPIDGNHRRVVARPSDCLARPRRCRRECDAEIRDIPRRKRTIALYCYALDLNIVGRLFPIRIQKDPFPRSICIEIVWGLPFVNSAAFEPVVSDLDRQGSRTVRAFSTAATPPNSQVS